MDVIDRPEPAAPGPGEAAVRPEAVGICGSDYSLDQAPEAISFAMDHPAEVMKVMIGGVPA
jgi:NADPH:quinone reductase-like Zn-dependent oxidoreductase